MKNRASLTAQYMALFRALESARPASSRLFCDPFATFFLSQRRKWLYGIASYGPGSRLVERLLDWKAPGARAAGIARTKWIDEEATNVLQKARQLVLLGAGFDCRGYRLVIARQSTIFELDQPETSLAKQDALKKAIGVLPNNVRFVTIDFNSQSLGAVLSQAGFDRMSPACFIWEGVTNYLSSEAVDSVLREIRQTAGGSVLLFSYIHRGVLERPQAFFGVEKLMSRLQSYGEPWTFGLHPEEIAAYLAARGLHLMKDLSVTEIWRDAGRPSSELHGYEFYRLASACVEG
jgi:methyltransferase (TIGR00027 family)